MKKILIIDAHPDNKSFCSSLAEAYFKASLSAGFETKSLQVRDLHFELNLKKGYNKVQELEPDLKKSQELIKWCDHMVLVYPMWWGTVPALLKGFFDRALLPGFAFKYHEKDPFWDKLLVGRSARMIVTSDAPYLYNLLVNFSAPYNVVKKSILRFCGFSPVKLTAIGGVKNMSPAQLSKKINKVENLGRAGV